jgi:epoxide hydrolase-like predicted phosphatase
MLTDRVRATKGCLISYNRGMIKAVLFDFGGVLSESGKHGSMRRLFGEVFGIDLRVMESDLRIDDLSRRMWRGQISDDEFFAEIKRRHPELPAVTKEEFMQHMNVLAERLRAQGIKTGILSNVFRMGAKPLREAGFYDGFDPVLLSCEVGYAKPDPEFYQMAVDKLGIRPEEIILIDDQEYVLKPARAMGMQVILAESPEQIVRDTEALIQKENGDRS